MSAVLKPVPEFRPMQQADVDSVMEIERCAYDFPWTTGIFRDCLRVGYCCWLLSQLSDIDAYSVMTVGAGEAHILNLCVRPDMQGRGLGRAMLDHLLDLASDHRADTVFLEVRPSNGAAINLYETMGFNCVGVRRNYYPAVRGREDALILAKTLT
jgi:[ribosomal protein S18]-alanine N-acetyltransferase